MPLFHVYAMAMGYTSRRVAAARWSIMPRYRPEAVLDMIERDAITIFPGSPTIYTGLLEHPSFAATDWSSVHTCYRARRPCRWR